MEIERTAQRVKVDIWTARPGIVIGRRGAEVDKVKNELEKITGKQVHVNIQEIRMIALVTRNSYRLWSRMALSHQMDAVLHSNGTELWRMRRNA